MLWFGVEVLVSIVSLNITIGRNNNNNNYYYYYYYCCYCYYYYRTCMLIDVGISGGRNVIKKKAENILKYKDLTIEIQHMWNVKTKVIPVIIGATGDHFKVI